MATFYEAKSETEKGKIYTVRFMDDETWRCNCPSFVFQNENRLKWCKHIIKIQNQLPYERDTEE